MENGAIKRMTICGSRPIFRRLILDGSKSGGKYFWVVSGQQGVRDEGASEGRKRESWSLTLRTFRSDILGGVN